MTTLTLNTLDVIFTLAEKIESFDYRKAANSVALRVVTFAAIVVAVATYVWTAAQLFWEEHGEMITVRFRQFIDATEAAIEATYDAGIAIRLAVNYWVARLTDSAFFALAN